MWKYIVIWVLVQWSSYSPPPKADPYGRMSYTLTLECHFRADTTYHKLEFTSRDEALKFIADAPKPDTSGIVFFNQAWCTDMELDSTWIPEQEAADADHK